MPSRKWSNGAKNALRRIKKNNKKDLEGALQEVGLDPGGSECKGRNDAVKARVHVELWRNGFHDSAALQSAHTCALSGCQLDGDDFYTNWKMAYALKYMARSRGRSHMGEAIPYYDHALASLHMHEPGNIDALRCVLIDRAEAFIYMSEADLAVTEITRAIDLGGTVQDWHRWALAFALHQAGEYSDSANEITRLLTGHPPKDLYYNDMRLLLAASQVRAGDTQAERTIKKFREVRDKAGEEVWTVTLERERGAFYPDSPGETHWRESLELLDPQALPR